MNGSGFDVVGDLHGHAGQLHRLLAKLGYLRKTSLDPYVHPDGRKVAFVGDFINRGPDGGEVLQVVRSMTEAGTALAVLGNHEFNLFTNAFLGRHQPPAECGGHLDWLCALPLSLETEGLRVVHAAWHPSSLKVVEGRTCEDEEFVRLAATKGTPEYKAANILLKGIKVPLPQDKVYRDRFGISRSKGRIRWWMEPEGVSYAHLVFPSCAGLSDRSGPPSSALEDAEPYPLDEIPVFRGHYCLPPSESKIHGNVACVDGCVTCDGILWAYRHNGERTLKFAHLVQSG